LIAMERSIQTVTRLIGSLETLANQETMLLADEAWSELASVQERASILVDKLSSLMANYTVRQSLPPDIFARARAIAQAQGIKIARLDESMTEIEEELQLLIASQQRVRSMRPIYRNRLEEGGLSGTFNGHA